MGAFSGLQKRVYGNRVYRRGFETWYGEVSINSDNCVVMRGLAPAGAGYGFITTGPHGMMYDGPWVLV